MPILTRQRLIKKSSALVRPLIRMRGGRHALSALRKIVGVTILTYHDVRPTPPAHLPLSLVTSTQRFEREMRWLRDHFELLTMSQAQEHLGAGSLRSHAVVVTFDDGFAGVRQEAYPILQRLGISATLFLNGRFYLGEDISARVKAEHLLAHRSLAELHHVCPSIRTAADVRRMVKDGSARSATTLDRLFREAKGQPNPDLHLHEADIRAMSPELIHVGNHGWSHRWLAGLSASEQTKEIQRSHTVLSTLPHFRPLFAPPFGTPQSVDATTQAIATRFYGGWLSMLGGGVNRAQAPAPRALVRNTVGNDKPPLLELLWLNLLGGGFRMGGIER